MRKMARSANTSCKVRSSACAVARSRPKGFSTITRASVGAARLGQALHDGGEHARRNRKVVDRPGRIAKRLFQFGECRGVRVVAVHVAQLRGEFLEAGGVEIAAVLDAVAGALLELLQRPARARHADDRNVEAVPLHHGVESGEDLLVCQVARGAEEDEGIGFE